MEKLIELLKQRRIWTAIFAIISLVLPMFGISINFDSESLIDALLSLVEAISGVLTIVLPILSYFKPKQ